MKYTIMEFENRIGTTIKDKDNNPYIFDNYEEANIDRIYHQPDYENLLKIITFTEKEYENV